MDSKYLIEFDSDTMLQLLAGLLQAKKMLFVSDKGDQAQATMLAVRDMLLSNAGFDWPYLFVTCLPFNNDVETTT